jgi:hypothetical protein
MTLEWLCSASKGAKKPEKDINMPKMLKNDSNLNVVYHHEKASYDDLTAD